MMQKSIHRLSMLSQQLLSGSVTHCFQLQSKDGAKLINLSVSYLMILFSNYIRILMVKCVILASKRLSDLIRRPFDLYRAGVFDEYVMGLLNQVAQAMDDSVTQEVTNNLFKKVGQHHGLDLVAFNMQRGRDFGLPGYMEFRKFCGLPEADSFDGMFGAMPNSTVNRYSSIYS